MAAIDDGCYRGWLLQMMAATEDGRGEWLLKRMDAIEDGCNR